MPDISWAEVALRLVLAAVVEGDVRTRLPERDGARPADAARRAGHQSDFAVESKVHPRRSVRTAIAVAFGRDDGACRGDLAVVSTVDFSYEASLIGLHGSLTPDEMLIPMLVD